MERKYRLLEGHCGDMFFIQEKSYISKRFEIIDIYYDQSLCEEVLDHKRKEAKEAHKRASPK